jgi:chromosome segregation ATPase
MQQMEVEFLLDEIRKFKMGINKVFGALLVDPDRRHDKGFKQEEISISHILNNIEGLKGSLVKTQEEKLQLLVENSVLLTVLSHQESEAKELDSQKRNLEHEFENAREQNVMLQKVKLELLEMNRQLRFELNEGEERENALKSEMEILHMKLVELQKTNLMFQEENRKVLEEKNSLIKSVSELKDAKSAAEYENSVMFHEALNLKSLSMVYESFFIEKVFEQKELSKHLSDLHSMNNNLKQELGLLREQFAAKEAENVYLKESVETADKDLQEARNTNDNLSHQIESSDILMKKKTELLIFRFHPLVKHCWKIR